MPTEQKDLITPLPAMDTSKTKWSQFGTLVSVFFFWGFVAASNDVLIPVFKEKLNLTQVQEHTACCHMILLYQRRYITRVQCMVTIK